MKTDNAMQLKSKINNKAKSLNISPQFVLQNYIMECFIKRISISEYKNNFILKGGLLIASLVGIQNRSTMDMDTTITGFTLEKEETIKILKQICSISCNDDFNFIFDRIEDIREDDEYSGLRAFLFADYEKIHAPFSIDITTGDKITPKEINYSFKRIFDKDVIEIYSYPIETVIAEKLEIDEGKITLDSSFRGDLGADSLDTYELVYAIEEELGVSIPDEKANEFETVRDAYNFIKAEQEKK